MVIISLLNAALHYVKSGVDFVILLLRQNVGVIDLAYVSSLKLFKPTPEKIQV